MGRAWISLTPVRVPEPNIFFVPGRACHYIAKLSKMDLWNVLDLQYVLSQSKFQVLRVTPNFAEFWSCNPPSNCGFGCYGFGGRLDSHLYLPICFRQLTRLWWHGCGTVHNLLKMFVVVYFFCFLSMVNWKQKLCVTFDCLHRQIGE